MNRQFSVCSKRLKSLKPALEEWIKLNEKLLKLWRPENAAPWWFNERASVSLFSGAVWNCGGWAFEEYVDLKRRGQRMTSGRVDLEFSSKESRFVAEAKQCGLSTRKQQPGERILRYMKKAKDDVLSCNPYGFSRLAIVFAVPYLSKKIGETEIREKTKIWEKTEELINEISNLKPKPDAAAWYFPSTAPLYEDKKIKRFYPGVFLLIWQV